MSFFEVFLFKYWSVEEKKCVDTNVDICDSPISLTELNKKEETVTKTLYLECLENKNLLGLKVTTQVKRKKNIYPCIFVSLVVGPGWA